MGREKERWEGKFNEGEGKIVQREDRGGIKTLRML